MRNDEQMKRGGMRQACVCGLVAVFCVVAGARAQERLSREETAQYARVVGADAAALKATPVPTEVDLKAAVAMREGDYGAMVLPQVRLSAEGVAEPGTNVVALGQIWFHKLAPMRDGSVVGSERLKVVTVRHDGDEVKVPQCTLGVRRGAEGGLELVVLGKETKPLVTAALAKIERKQDLPLDLAAERSGDDAGRITVRILGKYEASFLVTEWEGI